MTIVPHNLDERNSSVRTPLEKMCASFPGLHPVKEGIWRNEDNPRFDCYENDDGVIGINPWTGRSAENVLKMGNPPLTFADLYPDNQRDYTPTEREKPLDILMLADYLKLPWTYLYAIGYRDGYPYRGKNGYRTRCVRIGGYCNPDGTPYSKKRLRLSIDGKNRFRWDTGTPGEPIPCGLHTVGEAREKGYLIIGEGESDAATMWWHGFPYVGIAGTGCYKRLDVSLLHAIPRVYIIEEPDQVEKNEQGQGFYADVRSHLREHGYTGDIFSIRWKAAAGYKDPSMLHRCLYRALNQTEDAPDPAVLKAQFAQALAKALAKAIPEGNTSLLVQDEVLPEEPEPAPPLPATDDERIAWLKEMAAVSYKILSDRHKLILMIILLHSPVFNLKHEAWWRVDADFLAERAGGIDRDDILDGVSYLTKKVGLFTKRYEQDWYTGLDGKKKARTLLYIQPSDSTWVTYPSTWRLPAGTEERNHGGKRVPRPKCPVCQSENVDVYDATFCYTCKAIHYTPKQNAPERESEKPPEPEVEEQAPVESTAVVLPTEDEKMVRENGTGTPKMGCHESALSPSLVITPKMGCHESESENGTGTPKMGYQVPFCQMDGCQAEADGYLAEKWLCGVHYKALEREQKLRAFHQGKQERRAP